MSPETLKIGSEQGMEKDIGSATILKDVAVVHVDAPQNGVLSQHVQKPVDDDPCMKSVDSIEQAQKVTESNEGLQQQAPILADDVTSATCLVDGGDSAAVQTNLERMCLVGLGCELQFVLDVEKVSPGDGQVISITKIMHANAAVSHAFLVNLDVKTIVAGLECQLACAEVSRLRQLYERVQVRGECP